MPDTMKLDNVPGSHIVFRNFRGKPTPVTKGGDRNFCLIIPNRLIRDQLAARGCNIKKLKNKAIIDGEKLNDIEFVNIAVRITPKENEGDIWTLLDTNNIDNAWLEFSFYEYNINGKKGTRIYLRNAKFFIKEYFESLTICIGMPDMVRIVNNTNNTEETKMEKMTRAEVMGQLQMGITAFEMNKTNDPIVIKLMHAMKDAIEYIGEAPKIETKIQKVTVEKRVHDYLPGIKQVIFNDPATIVVWFDDVKTVVKCQEGDNFDKEKGLAMAICKRLYGNESNFNNLIKKWTEPNVKKAVKEVIKKAEINKTAKNKSKAKKNVKDTSNVIITDAYINHVRVKMAKRGIKSYNELAKMCGVSQTTFSRSFGNAKRKSRVMYRSTFNKINKTLGIRWG